MTRDELVYRTKKHMKSTERSGFHPLWFIRYRVHKVLRWFKPTRRRLIKSEELKDRAIERFERQSTCEHSETM